MKLTKVLTFLALGGIFTSGLPMQFLPVSPSQMCVILLFLLTAYYTKLSFNRVLWQILAFFMLVTIINYKYMSIVNWVQYIRFAVYFLAYYMYLKMLGRESLNGILKKYLYLCYVASIIGFVQVIGYALNIRFLYDFSFIDGFDRNFDAVYGIFKIMSVTTEPAHFGLILLPAMFLIIKGFFEPGVCERFGLSKLKIKIISVAFLLTFSFTAYFSLMIVFGYHFFTLFKINFKYIALLAVSVLFGFIFLFYLDSNIKAKKDSLFADSSELQSIENLSAFALISNAEVAWAAANDHFFGTGFYTHKDNYDRYIGNFFLLDNGSVILNRADGSSMYVKILSEYGYAGLLLMLIMFYQLRYKGVNHNLLEMNHLSIVTLLVGFIRLANYTYPLFGLLFALMIFTKSAGNEERLRLSTSL